MSWQSARIKKETHSKVKEIAQLEGKNHYEVIGMLVDHYYDIVKEEMEKEPQITPTPETEERQRRITPDSEAGEATEAIEGTRFIL